MATERRAGTEPEDAELALTTAGEAAFARLLVAEEATLAAPERTALGAVALTAKGIVEEGRVIGGLDSLDDGRSDAGGLTQTFGVALSCARFPNLVRSCAIRSPWLVSDICGSSRREGPR